jgi:hypothetical protein
VNQGLAEIGARALFLILARMRESAPTLDRDMLETLPCSDAKTPFGLMRFRLTYAGRLPPVGDSNQLETKWEIRRQISPQLEELYRVHPVLSARADSILWVGKPTTAAFDAVREPKTILDRQFISLVRASVGLTCRLDITYLRRGEPGRLILEKGDLDNRLNTLFDGLRLPHQSDMHKAVKSDGPMYCLLEDDKLVTGVAIDTDRLLSIPPTASDDYSLVIMDVTVRITHVIADNSIFLAD